jgi:hypothetical protein
MPEADYDLDALGSRCKVCQVPSIFSVVIRSLLVKEIPKSKNVKEIIKSTRNKLHQVGSAYQEKPIPYEVLL